MNNTVTDFEVNIEDLNRVLTSIQVPKSAASIRELTKELETIAISNNVTAEALFDLAETSQLQPNICSRVMSLDHQIKNLKSNS